VLVRCWPVASIVTVTFALGTVAPLSSFTKPANVEVFTWALIGRALPKSVSKADARIIVDFMFTPVGS
jgi:hypothetical protein